jgi:RNA polymerase sigma-70 factor (ECF subfamily)
MSAAIAAAADAGPRATGSLGGYDAWRAGQDFRTELLALIPALKAFARKLCGDRAGGEDLAQETLAKAWQYRRSFHPGTNLKAWLFTIARNEFYTSRRRAQREAPFDQAEAEQLPGNGVDQIWSTDLSDTLRAVGSLPAPLREALLLVGAGGCSYQEVARICDCPVGTAKSRVSRARRALATLLDEAPSAYGERLGVDRGDNGVVARWS